MDRYQSMPRYSSRLPTVLIRHLCDPASHFERLLRARCLSWMVMDYENLSEMIRVMPRSIVIPILRRFYESVEQKKMRLVSYILGHIGRKDLSIDRCDSGPIFPLLIEWNRADLIEDVMSWFARSGCWISADVFELLQYNYDRRTIQILMSRVCVIGNIIRPVERFFVWMCNDLRESGISYTHDCEMPCCLNRA